jgi:AAA15 family ATPase/GTPase
VLINFYVKNFRSIRDEINLNMVSDGRYKNHLDHREPILGMDKHALKLAVLYGANAAGKSNIVRAIDFAQDMVIEGETAIRRLAGNQFARRTDNPSEFQFQFQAEGYQFDFGFELNEQKVISEWLIVEGSEQSRRESMVYERKGEELDIGKLTAFSDGKMTSELLQTLSTLGIKDEELLLNKVLESSAESKRGAILNAAINWFVHSLKIILPQSSFASLLTYLDNDARFRNWSAGFLSSVDTGIRELSVNKESIDSDSIPSAFAETLQAGAPAIPLGPGIELAADDSDSSRIVRRNLRSKHVSETEDFDLPFADESDGTQRFLELLPALYPHGQVEQDRSTVYIIDELDRSLHPLLSRAFLQFFADASRDKQNQLIITTHETHLMDSDLLRRDEIWFVEKGIEQTSTLSSLSEFKIRNDLKLERGYLHGRFGAIPFVRGLEQLFELQDFESEAVH